MLLLNADLALTRRETDIIERIANGYSAKEVAQQVRIAPRTVERHIENARHKLGAKNTAHLITRAVMTGLLSFTSPR